MKRSSRGKLLCHPAAAAAVAQPKAVTARDRAVEMEKWQSTAERYAKVAEELEKQLNRVTVGLRCSACGTAYSFEIIDQRCRLSDLPSGFHCWESCRAATMANNLRKASRQLKQAEEEATVSDELLERAYGLLSAMGSIGASLEIADASAAKEWLLAYKKRSPSKKARQKRLKENELGYKQLQEKTQILHDLVRCHIDSNPAHARDDHDASNCEWCTALAKFQS